MDHFNHLEYLIGKSKYNKIIYVPAQDPSNMACTFITFEAIKKAADLVNAYFNNSYKFVDIYKQIIEDGEKNRKQHGGPSDGNSLNDKKILMLYSDINKSVEKNGGYITKYHNNCVHTSSSNDIGDDFFSLDKFNNSLMELNEPNKFMIVSRDTGTFVLLSIAQNNHVLVIDTHFPCSGVLSFDSVKKYIFQNGLYNGLYEFGVGCFINKQSPSLIKNKKSSKQNKLRKSSNTIII